MSSVLSRTVVGALAALALSPAVAAASTVAYEGDALVVRAAPGAQNSLTLSSERPGTISVSDTGDPVGAFPADRCERLSEDYPLHCELPARVRVELGDRDDAAVVSHMVPAGLDVEVLGGDGGDDLKTIAGQTRATLDGEAGDDALRSEDGGDVLRGGPGDDELLGLGGDDELHGGDGDDRLEPDGGAARAGNDLVDGGPGTDSADDWVAADRSRQGAVSITLNGVADDGRPGERDDVRGIEQITAFAAGTYVMGDTADRVAVYAPPEFGPSTVQGRGGDDQLTGGNAEQALDGGAGADRVEGGFGHDTLVGGPGRDAIFGDSTASQCGVLQSCTLPFGNDVIDARDGEADTVSCGVGADTVKADAADTVAADCETVERSGAGGAGRAGGASGGGGAQGAPGAGGPAPVPAAARLRVTPARLRVALRRGLRVTLSGMPAGRVTVVLRQGRRVVGRGAARIAQDGSGKATVRFTRAARRGLGRRRAVRLTLVAGAARGSVTLGR